MQRELKTLKHKIILAAALLLKSNEFALWSVKKIIESNYKNPRKRIINYDALILSLVEKILENNNISLNQQKSTDSKHILILNTEIYDSGGHTELVLRFVKAFKDDFPITFLLSGIGAPTQKSSPVKAQLIKENVTSFIELPPQKNFIDNIVKIYNLIIDSKITTVMVNTHMNDIVATAVLGLLKKHTSINVVFINHADHRFTLGTEFADVILTRCKDKKAITPHIEKKQNVKNILFLETSNEVESYSQEEINATKEKLGISLNSVVTLTGCQSYKINFEYIMLIAKLLNKNPNMCHIMISTFSMIEKKLIKFFLGKNAARFIFLDITPKFGFYVQLSDIYIDSFPQGSALTLVDCIKQSKPVVIKVNKNNPIRSFESYLPDDYEYSCKTVEEVFQKASKLVREKEEYIKISTQVREFYLERYQINSVKSKYMEIIK